MVLLNILIDELDTQNRIVVMVFADDPKLGNVCRVKEDKGILQEELNGIESQSDACWIKFGMQGLELVLRNRSLLTGEKKDVNVVTDHRM